MNWYGNVIAEGVVVEDIDAKEEDNIDQPATDGHLVWCQEKGRPSDIELCNVSCDSHEEKLRKSEQDAWSRVKHSLRGEGGVGSKFAGVPLDGSKLRNVRNKSWFWGRFKTYLTTCSKA